jgi:putative acetyltransferase
VELEVAEMSAGDYDEVIALWKSSDGLGLNDADTRECIEAYLVRNPGLSLVAKHRGRIVGAVLCGHDGRRGYLHHLAVAESFRRHGIASQLVERCLASLAAMGIQRCNIFLYANNEPGERFWRKIGWVDRAELKVFSKDIRAGHSSLASGPGNHIQPLRSLEQETNDPSCTGRR